VFLADLACSRTMRPGAREATEAFVVATLRARFAMETWHAAHPAAAASPVTRPLIVLCMPRAGTTFLVNLLGLDPQRRMHWHWEGNCELPPAEAAHPLSMTNSDVDLPMVGYQVSGILAASAQRMIAARDRHPDHAFHDIHYRDFVRDPMATIRALYAFEGLELSDVVAQAMQAAIARHAAARSHAGPHVYRLADYALDEAAIDRLFGDYIARFDVALERR